MGYECSYQIDSGQSQMILIAACSYFGIHHCAQPFIGTPWIDICRIYDEYG